MTDAIEVLHEAADGAGKAMTRDEAMAVLCEAADRWAAEIVEYVIPDGSHEPEDIAGLVKQVNEINEALVLLGGDAYAAYTHKHTAEEFE